VNDLPGEPEAILEPAELAGGFVTTLSEPLPGVVHRFLVPASHLARDGFGEGKEPAAVQGREGRSTQLEVDGRDRTLGTAVDLVSLPPEVGGPEDAQVREGSGAEVDGLFGLSVEPEARADHGGGDGHLVDSTCRVPARSRVERNAELAEKWKDVPDRMIVGDAANREVLEEAGIADAPSVLLTTNSDAANVFLAVYCRKLNDDPRIVSRVTHERSVDSIRRAEADRVLSYQSQAVQTISARARVRPLVLLGEGVELMEEDVPESLSGNTLTESEIGARTGLAPVAIRDGDHVRTSFRSGHRLEPGNRLVMVGAPKCLETFHKGLGG
jgi:Trk K+ transport system NAD-binding subunit